MSDDRLPAMISVHQARNELRIEVESLAWERKIPSIKIAAKRFVPTAFLRRLKQDQEGTLRDYAKASRYWTVEPVWTPDELAVIAEIREEAVAHAMRRHPNRRPKWLDSELAAAEASKPAQEPERSDQRPAWMTSARTGQPHPLPIIVVERMHQMNEGELKTFLALYHLSLGTLQGLERIGNDQVGEITGMHRTNVYRARKRLEARGFIPVCGSAQADPGCCAGAQSAAESLCAGATEPDSNGLAHVKTKRLSTESASNKATQ